MRAATQALLSWARQQLDVPRNASARLWLWRLFVRPASVPWLHTADLWRVWVGCANALGLLARVLGLLLRWSWRAAAWPIQVAIRFLDRVAARLNTHDLGAQADQKLLPLLRIRWIPKLLLLVCLLCGVLVITTPFNGLGQFIFLLLCWACSMVLRRMLGRFAALALSALTLLAMGRYVWWRITHSLDFDSDVETMLGYGLLAAEAYTWLIVLLGLIQTAWPLKRTPTALGGAPSSWPTVDVLVPTYNEPLSVLRPTILATLALDWPRDKLRIFILDDGRRDEVREFAQSMGVGYLVRPDNSHAKAGNLNHALAHTEGELVAIFDCDHMPTSSFLQTSVGWFQRDPRCAMLQTPHHFFSPDPFERNLGTFRRVPNEGALFYGLIQDGNDFWNATFFCGSCAVIRRAPLMQIGGIAVETVTEDAHTALKLHRLGYTTAYINQTQAAGLATESLAAHVGQRMRWARGMAQIFRLDNPFLGRGLSLWQRLCYANAMLHFFFGLPRLVFLTAPMAFLFFHWHIMSAAAIPLALYVLPYILQSSISNAYAQGAHRHSFWAEVYETVLAWYLTLPTTLALLNPRAGKFNVTSKGGQVSETHFDWVISAPYTVLVVLNLTAFGMGLARLVYFNPDEFGTVTLNLIWTAYSLLMLGAAIGVATEAKQVRRTHRVASELPASLYLPDGTVQCCDCSDFSMSGLGLRMAPGVSVAPGTQVQVGLWRDDVEHVFPATVMLGGTQRLGLQLDAMSQAQEIAFVQCTFARPSAWTHWNESNDTNRPLHGLQEIIQLGLQGYAQLGSSLWARMRLRSGRSGAESLGS